MKTAIMIIGAVLTSVSLSASIAFSIEAGSVAHQPYDVQVTAHR